jgi:predicted RNA-binding protein YlqC (UPF0109 family)
MVLKLISRLFGSLTGSDAPKPEGRPGAAGDGAPDPVALIEFLARGLANVPEAVKVETEQGDHGLIIRLRCDASDMGRMIGKNGKTIGAIRHLATDVAARDGIKVRKIELIEP